MRITYCIEIASVAVERQWIHNKVKYPTWVSNNFCNGTTFVKAECVPLSQNRISAAFPEAVLKRLNQTELQPGEMDNQSS